MIAAKGKLQAQRQKEEIEKIYFKKSPTSPMGGSTSRSMRASTK